MFPPRVTLSLAVGLVLSTAPCWGQPGSEPPPIRDELGVIMAVPLWTNDGGHAPGELLVGLRSGYLEVPDGATLTPMERCRVETDLGRLFADLTATAVRKVFPSCHEGDIERIVNGEVVRVPDLSRVFMLQLPPDTDLRNAIRALRAHPGVLYAEPNWRRELYSDSNDPLFEDQWDLYDPDFGIGCSAAWDYATGANSLKIAIMDQGIDYCMQDLGGSESIEDFPNLKVTGGRNYMEVGTPPHSRRRDHGTSCAGIAAAWTNNNIGVAGIAGGWGGAWGNPGAQLYAIRVDFEHATDAEIAQAIQETADPRDMGCHILSNSYGFPAYSETMRQAVLFACAAGANFVAAKGNADAYTPRFPGDFDYSKVTAVGAYGPDGQACDAGITCGNGSNCGWGIDLVAPGDDCLTTFRCDEGVDLYEGFAGTSAATPHVAGALALVRSLGGAGVTNQDAEWILKYSAWDYFADNNPRTWDKCYGHGDLRVSTALERMASYSLFTHTVQGGEEFPGMPPAYRMAFMSGILEGEYDVIPYRVEHQVTYPELYNQKPFPWGVCSGTLGWSLASPNYQTGWCRVVPGSETKTGCKLETYVFRVSEPGVGFIGWFPCRPQSVRMKYKVWGPVSGGIGTSSLIPQPVSISRSGSFLLGCADEIRDLIEFEAARGEDVELGVYDINGRCLRVLYNGRSSGNMATAMWDGIDSAGQRVPGGIYFYKLVAGATRQCTRVVLVR